MSVFLGIDMSAKRSMLSCHRQTPRRHPCKRIDLFVKPLVALRHAEVKPITEGAEHVLWQQHGYPAHPTPLAIFSAQHQPHDYALLYPYTFVVLCIL